MLKVSGVTIGNGGDNISIYTAVFAVSTGAQVAISIGIFLGLVIVWLLITYFLTSRPFVLNIMSKYGTKVVPFILIGLGLYIIISNNAFPWLINICQTKKWPGED